MNFKNAVKAKRVGPPWPKNAISSAWKHINLHEKFWISPDGTLYWLAGLSHGHIATIIFPNTRETDEDEIDLCIERMIKAGWLRINIVDDSSDDPTSKDLALAIIVDGHPNETQQETLRRMSIFADATIRKDAFMEESVAQPQRLTRGIANISPDKTDGWPREVAERLINGTATISDIALAIDFRHLGHNWWREGEEDNTHESNLEDSKDYAFTESDVLLKNAITYLNEPEDEFINGSIAVAFVAEVPKRVPENTWSGEIPTSTRLTIKEIYYDAGNGWNVLHCNIGARP